MARKINPKLHRQNNGGVEDLNRRPGAPPVAALYLMKLRTQGIKIAQQPRRTRVEIDAEADTSTPQPVKIVKIDNCD